MSGLALIPSTVVIVFVVVAAVLDLWRFRIPNAVTLPVLAAGLGYHAVLGPPGGFVASLGGLAVGFGILFALFACGMMGAGDVKLMAALGTWIGAQAVFHVFVASALATGVWSLVVLLTSSSVAPAPNCALEEAVQRMDRRRRAIPFAATTAVGVIALSVFSHLQ